MRGQRHSREGPFWILGEREKFWRSGDCIGAFSGGRDWKTVFFWFRVWWTVTGVHRLLGVLGFGARNPHGILELGSRIGSVPSWQGGRIWFWAEFGKSSNEDRWRLEE